MMLSLKVIEIWFLFTMQFGADVDSYIKCFDLLELASHRKISCRPNRRVAKRSILFMVIGVGGIK